MDVMIGNSDIPFAYNNYYSRMLLKRGLPYLVYDKYGQSKPLPKNNTDLIKFRRYESLVVDATPLTPGITPDGADVSTTDVLGQAKQYGNFIRFNDTVTTLNPDPVLVEFTSLLREQWAQTIDEVAREKITAGTNVQFADASAPKVNTERSHVLAADVIDLTEVQLVVRTLKRFNARKITQMVNPSNGYASTPVRDAYIGIVHVDTSMRLKNTTGFKPVETYAASTNTMENEIGALDEVRFVETSNGKVWPGEGGGSPNADVYGTIIFGADAYGTVRITNESTNVIVKPIGSGGPDDPLDQRGTMGWKQWYDAVILNQKFLVRLEHAV